MTKPAPALTADQHLVLHTLATCDDDHRPYVRVIAADLGIPVERLRTILRYFATLGLVTYGPIFNPDTGTPSGSTWWLTPPGVALRQATAEPA